MAYQLITHYLDKPIQTGRVYDIFLPETVQHDTAIFLIHGGGWTAGSRISYHTPIMETLAEKGYIVASTDYRLTVSAMEQLKDCREAYMHFINELRKLGRPMKTAVYGSSAGAHLSSLLAVAKPGASGEDFPADADWVVPECVLLQSCPMSFEPWEEIFPHIWSSMQKAARVPYEENPEVYKKIVRRDQFEKVMEGFQAALKYPQIPLKVNCVPMGMEGQDILQMAELARKYPVHVRFIEMMPIGLGKQFDFCSEDEILQGLKERFGEYVPYEKKLGNGPGHYYSFDGFQGKIGFISAISHKFCDSCNRVRLTAQGYLKTCLQYDIGVDLKKLLRKDAGEEALIDAINEAIYKKPVGHQFGSEVKEHGEAHMMAQIGG